MSLFESFLRRCPGWMLDAFVTAGSTQLQWKRRSGVYRERLREHRSYQLMPRQQLLEVQQKKTRDIIDRARSLSPFYREKYRGLDTSKLENLPVLEKHELQNHIDAIVIGDKERLHPMFTGGTTGRAITVYNDISHMQERAALLDLFWARHGYKLGRDRIAWFSGRALLQPGDERRRRFWRTNWLQKIRYYSTFHLSMENLPAYVSDLNRFKPRFLSGFPSAIGELARFVQSTGTPLSFKPEAIFTTSETLTGEQRQLFERVFGCRVANQYASSEGAPWIAECEAGSLHVDVTTGVFEVLDRDHVPPGEGEVLVTGFITRETPLIRYRIGDRVRLASGEAKCSCGWDTPLAEAVLGRESDFVEVPGRGRIFNSQIGDCVKDVTTVISFQVKLEGDLLHVYMVADRGEFDRKDRTTFMHKVHERFGPVSVEIHFVDSLPRSRSGKQSMIWREPVA